MKTLVFLLICMLATATPAFAKGNLDFTLHKLDSGKPGITMLVFGGIQGDEPGGFNAASLLVSNYKITKGCVWVVPNLNFTSIVRNSRGVYGDLNRKFSVLKHTDPEFEVIREIKSIIRSKEVDIILNLHDGSGYYRPKYVDKWNNPRRWGQSVIIDQENIPVERFGNLGEMARSVVQDVNRYLIDSEHVYHVKDTHTRLGDHEMEKSLTYFAINSGKSAFGIEASKNFPTRVRSYYHLQAVESFMDLVGIGYERDFKLSAQGVQRAIDSNLALTFNDRRIFLNLEDIRSSVGYFPLKKGSPVEFIPSNPLLTVIGAPPAYKVYYGNHHLTTLQPQFFDYDLSVGKVGMDIDGVSRYVPLGTLVEADGSFRVHPKAGCRVNVIGFAKKGGGSEDGVTIRKADFLPGYSLDKKNSIYRVEVYKGSNFSGMVLVCFRDEYAPYYTSRETFLTQATELEPRVLLPAPKGGAASSVSAEGLSK